VCARPSRPIPDGMTLPHHRVNADLIREREIPGVGSATQSLEQSRRGGDNRLNVGKPVEQRAHLRADTALGRTNDMRHAAGTVGERFGGDHGMVMIRNGFAAVNGTAGASTGCGRPSS
jgi:hypothetical protein